MDVRVISGADVARLLPMDRCIEVMGAALAALARGEAVLPLRSMVWLPDRSGLLGLMPAHLGAPRAFGLKVVSVFPGNHAAGLDSHQGVVILFDPHDGRPLAIIDANSITAIRTAAVSGLATRLLARPDADDLAILGSGAEARTHLEAMRAARPLRRVRVWSPTAERAERFARRAAGETGLAIEAVGSAREAVLGADLVCTVTAAREPVLLGEWLAPGTHVNAVGACFPAARELDTVAVVRSRLFVDRRESALNEAGDFLIPRREGAIGDEHIAGELGEVVIGRVPGRRSEQEITLFKSLGVAVEDLAAAHYVAEQAQACGAGAVVAL